MKTENLIDLLKGIQSGTEKKLIQVDFLFASIIQDIDEYDSEQYHISELGKYNTHVIKPFQFYKPYSKLFNIVNDI